MGLGLLALSLLLVAGCRQAPAARMTAVPVAPAAAPAPTSPPAEEGGARIEVEPRGPGRWRVTYHLDRPTRKLRFMRPAQWFREKTWTVQTPGYALAREGNSQVLRAGEGAPSTDTLALDVVAHTRPMNGEFRPVLAFSDGSTALYTSHLYLRDVADETSDDAPYLARLVVKTAPDVTLMISGEVIAGGRTTLWTDPSLDGTYIYFHAPGAKLETRADARMTTILDPGLSPDIQARVHELFPRIFVTLAEELDAPLPWTPMILVSWEQESRRDFEGSAVPGLIAIGLGGGWNLDENGSLVDLAFFFAHEAAHFWNGSIIRNRDNGSPWLHEGSADALADLVLQRHALIDTEALRARRERAINHCLDALEGTALASAASRRGRQVSYPCGHLMAIWSDAAVGAADLFAIWAALIDRAAAARTYGPTDYFAVLRDLGADAARVGEMEAFVGRDSRTQRRDLVASFARVGLALTPARRPPAGSRSSLARNAVGHLQDSLCGARSISSSETVTTIYPLANCPAFAVEAEIYQIAGRPVTDGDLVYARVRAACAKGRPVELAGADGEVVVSVPCTEPLRERDRWLTLKPLRGRRGVLHRDWPSAGSTRT